MTRESVPATPDSEPQIEKKERVPHPVYEVRIDKEKVAESKELPDGIKEWVSRLPESIRFTEPITLIVGENGSGKTSLARAILRARGEAQETANPGNINNLLMEQNEPAAVLANALTVEEARRDDPNFKAVFIEGSQVMSEIRRWAKEESRRSKENTVEGVSGGSYTHRLSSRQLFEQCIKDLKKMMIDFNRRRVAHMDVVFDEPEQGLSPHRQLDLPDMVSQLIDDGDTLLVPTNNLVLFLSDLPRLDLSQPERGIFKPSDYHEEGKIEFHGNKE